MSNPFLNLNKNNHASPFWIKPKKSSDNVKRTILILWKLFKYAILIFFVVLGLWGCFQITNDSAVHTSSTLGEGIEFGFYYGKTGNFVYDLQSNGNVGYHTFSEFSFQYGPFYALFIYPGSYLCTSIMWGCRGMSNGMNTLLSLFVLLFIIRGFSLFVTLRSSMQSEKMSEVQGKIAEINAKYKGANDMYSRQKKSQEIMDIYRRNKIKPFAAIEQVLITLPIFMVIYRVVTIVRPIKASVLFGLWSFASNPFSEITQNFANGGWVYIFFLLIVMPAQVISSIAPQIWAKKRNRNSIAIGTNANKQYKKTRLIQYVFIGVMCVIVAGSATGVGVYWFMSSIFSIIQSYIIHKIIINSRKKKNSAESTLEKILA